MLIPVLTEPNFRSYLWAAQTMEGVAQEAARRKYKTVTLDAEAYKTIDYDRLFGDERRMLIVIGTSVSWMPGALACFNSRSIESVVISFDPSETTLPAGMVRMDYVGAISHLLAYLSSCGRRRIALYGYNPNSSADNIKLRFFSNWCKNRGYSAEERVFFNYADLSACYARMRPRVRQFDAVICANDIAAVSLLSHLRADGVRVPEDLFVTAFGDSLIAARVDPPLTIATLDHRELGRQAVLLFYHRCRQPSTASVSARVRSKLIVRGSTACMPDMTSITLPEDDADAFESSINFYNDPEAERLLRAETLLSAADELDMRLLSGLLAGCSLEKLEQTLFLTASALQYRKKRLMNIARCAHTSDLLEFLRFCREKGIL